MYASLVRIAEGGKEVVWADQSQSVSMGSICGGSGGVNTSEAGLSLTQRTLLRSLAANVSPSRSSLELPFSPRTPPHVSLGILTTPLVVTTKGGGGGGPGLTPQVQYDPQLQQQQLQQQQHGSNAIRTNSIPSTPHSLGTKMTAFSSVKDVGIAGAGPRKLIPLVTNNTNSGSFTNSNKHGRGVGVQNATAPSSSSASKLLKDSASLPLKVEGLPPMSFQSWDDSLSHASSASSLLSSVVAGGSSSNDELSSSFSGTATSGGQSGHGPLMIRQPVSGSSRNLSPQRIRSSTSADSSLGRSFPSSGTGGVGVGVGIHAPVANSRGRTISYDGGGATVTRASSACSGSSIPLRKNVVMTTKGLPVPNIGRGKTVSYDSSGGGGGGGSPVSLSPRAAGAVGGRGAASLSLPGSRVGTPLAMVSCSYSPSSGGSDYESIVDHAAASSTTLSSGGRRDVASANYSTRLNTILNSPLGKQGGSLRRAFSTPHLPRSRSPPPPPLPLPPPPPPPPSNPSSSQVQPHYLNTNSQTLHAADPHTPSGNRQPSAFKIHQSSPPQCRMVSPVFGKKGELGPVPRRSPVLGFEDSFVPAALARNGMAKPLHSMLAEEYVGSSSGHNTMLCKPTHSSSFSSSRMEPGSNPSPTAHRVPLSGTPLPNLSSTTTSSSSSSTAALSYETRETRESFPSLTPRASSSSKLFQEAKQQQQSQPQLLQSQQQQRCSTAGSRGSVISAPRTPMSRDHMVVKASSSVPLFSQRSAFQPVAAAQAQLKPQQLQHEQQQHSLASVGSASSTCTSSLEGGMREGGGGGGGGGGDDESLRGRESGEGAEGSRRAMLVLRQVTREEKTREGEREGEGEVVSNIHVKKEEEGKRSSVYSKQNLRSKTKLSTPFPSTNVNSTDHLGGRRGGGGGKEERKGSGTAGGPTKPSVSSNSMEVASSSSNASSLSSSLSSRLSASTLASSSTTTTTGVGGGGGSSSTATSSSLRKNHSSNGRGGVGGGGGRRKILPSAMVSGRPFSSSASSHSNSRQAAHHAHTVANTAATGAGRSKGGGVCVCVLFMCVCVCVCVCLFLCSIQVYSHTHTLTHTHTHTHTHT